MRRRCKFVGNRAVRKASRRFHVEPLEERRLLANAPLITEFLASNGSYLADGDGQYSDWIEIYNPTSQSINLAGWHLTDSQQDPAKWTFPALSQSIIDPGEYLIVFASGQLTENYVDPAGNLHTDFALSQDGEYLALTDPGNSVVHAYAPQYPGQRRDVSFGVLENIEQISLLGDSHVARAIVPTNSSLDATNILNPPAWTVGSFNDASWPASVGGPGVGFDVGDEPVPDIPNGTILPEGLIGGDLTDPEEDGSANGVWFAGGFPGSPVNEEPDKALDNTVFTKWLAFQPSGTYYGFRFADGARHAVNAYTISSANDAVERDPYSWTLSGSNDGVNYTVVDTRTAQTFGSRFETHFYEFNNALSFEYYRFDFLTRFGATGQDQPVAIQMAEIELFNTGPVDYAPAIDLDVAAAYDAAKTSVYQRIKFNVTDPALFASLQLNLQYDDGFVAYLNGKRVAAVGAPALPHYNSNASTEREDSDSLAPQSFNLTPYLGDLVVGENVLAIHVLNVNDASPDLLSRPELIATRVIDDTLQTVYMATPTPGTANLSGFAGLVAEPQFSVGRGFYSAPFQVTIATSTPGAEIYYTTNGLAPTPQNGTLYSGPLQISSTSTIRAQAFFAGYLDSTPETHTYVFVNDVVRQTYQATINKGFPTTWGGTSPDYGMDPDVIGNFDAAGNPTGGDLFNGQYAATIKNDLLALPTLSIVMSTSEMFGPNGIYTNSTAGGDAWERAASVELIYPSGEQGFQIDAGIRTQGGAFRSHGLTRKHSLRLLFKGEYQGNTKLEFPWFGPDAVASFDTITLRADANDGYSWDAAGSRAQYARDEFGRRSQADLGQHAAHGTRVHLYINGVYWGIYNPVERPDASFSAAYYGGAKEEWDVINSGAATDGTMDTWNTLVSLSQAVASAASESARTTAYMRVLGLNANGTDNPSYETYLDAVNYIDYLILNFYGANVDWPHRNWYAGRQRGAESQGFTFHIWDYETSLGLTSDVNTNNLGVSDGAAAPYARLKSSLEFRLAFADRVHRALFNDGALTSANSIARYQEIVGELPQAIVAESARWGDQHRHPPYTKANWQSSINTVVNFLSSRNNIFIQQLRNAGLYPNTAAPVMSQFGGQITPGFKLTLTAPAGTIWYTLDGSDPRSIGGGISPTAIQYTGQITLNASTQVNSRVRNGSDWSAVTATSFSADLPLRITELHYNPAAHPGVDDRQNLEFIELLNTGPSTISLNGVKIADFANETYEFPGGLSLASGQRIVVARDPAVFQSVYGPHINVSPLGYGENNLSNGGETVTLLNSLDQPLQSIEYTDLAPWPESPDGDGPSLEIINPLGDASSAANWRASLSLGGSPGRSGATPAAAGDFDNDGYVEASDLARWKAFVGAPSGATSMTGDADADGDVDGADLLLWQRTFGTITAVAASSAAALAAEEETAAPVEVAAAIAERDANAVDAALAGLAWRVSSEPDAGAERVARVPFRPASPASVWSSKAVGRSWQTAPANIELDLPPKLSAAHAGDQLGPYEEASLDCGFEDFAGRLEVDRRAR